MTGETPGDRGARRGASPPPAPEPERSARLARWIVKACVEPEAVADVIEDLFELRELERERAGAARARAYFWAQVIAYPARAAVAGPRAWLRRLATAHGSRSWPHDLRQALRALVRTPGHSLVAASTLGLSIAAVTLVFSLVNMLLFAPLPFADSDRLVTLYDVVDGPGRAPERYTPSPRTTQLLRELVPELERVAGHRFATFVVEGGVEPTLSIGIRVTDGWLETLGVRPALGRGFSPAEQAAGSGARVALLGEALWRRALGGDEEVIGSTVRLNGVPHLVAGIMPAGFRFPWGGQVWVQSDLDPTESSSSMGTVARLAAGVAPTELAAALGRAGRQAAELYPETHSELRFEHLPLREYLVDNRADIAWLLFGAVLLLLVLACTNVAGLATVRVLGQERQLAVRAALGSGRARLFRLVFLEGAVLAAGGGLVGLALTGLLKDRLGDLAAASQSGVGLVASVAIDLRVAAFAFAATGMTALLASLLPAFRAMSATRVESITRSRGAGDHLRTQRALASTVFAQAAIASSLLAVAVALAQSYARLESIDRGFEVDDRSVVRVVLPDERFADGAGRWQALEELAGRLTAQPEIVAAGYTHHLPTTPGGWPRQYTIESAVPTDQTGQLANARWIGTSYFEAMGMRLRAGRVFTAEEMAGRARVVVVSSGVAERLGGDAIGRRLKTGLAEDDTPWLEIVGVVDQAREEWDVAESLYVPYSTREHEWVEMVLHTRAGADSRRVAEIVHSAAPDQPVDDVRRLEDLLGADLRGERLATIIALTMAASGLAITLLGTYGLVAYQVRRRRRELGVRLAMGCGQMRLTGRVVSRGVGLVVAGVAVGLPLSLGIVVPLFFAAGAADDAEVQLLVHGLHIEPVTVVVVLTIVVLSATAACLGPAARAVGADPLAALRED